MFSVAFDKDRAAWSLGQQRTLGRALELRSVEEKLTKWRAGDFSSDLLAGRICPDIDLPSVLISDQWGAWLLDDLWSGRVLLSKGSQPRRALGLARRVVKAQMELLPTVTETKGVMNKIFDKIEEDGITHTLMCMSHQLRMVIEKSLPSRNFRAIARKPTELDALFDRYSSYEVGGTSLRFRFTGSVVFVWYRDMCYACTQDHLICYANKVDALLSYRLMLAWMKETYITLQDGAAIEELIGYLHRSHIMYGQKFFECAKLLDGLCQAYFLKRPEVDGPVNDLMLKQIKIDCADDQEKSDFISGADDYLRQMTGPALIEASCLGKCSGHPTVDVAGGLEQLRERTTNERNVSAEAVLRSVRALKKQYTTNYIIKNKVWPPLMGTPSANICHLRLLDAIPDGPQAAQANVTLSDTDWDSLDFAPTRSLVPVTSLLPYIKDKTISLDRDDTLTNYDHPDFEDVVFTLKEELTGNEMYERTALVLYVLLTRDLKPDFISFMDKVIASSRDDFTDVLSYLIIKVVPKEGELKTKARLFGEKTFNYRLLSMLQETNSARFLQDVFPSDQAMTCGELELNQRLLALTTIPPPSPAYEYVHLVTDISGWNNGFRDESVRGIGEVMDQIFGTNLFGKTQKLYENSLIVNRDGDTMNGWNGQKGGIEGLNQDTWVVAYLSQMHSIFSQLQYPYFFMDMGDNFIVKLAVPRAELANFDCPASFAMDLSKKLALDVKLFGHDIKPDESTCSHQAFIFCHAYRVRGIQIPAHLRKAAKMSGTTDAFFPDLDGYIGCAFSNAHATAEQGPLAVGPFYCANVWMGLHLLAAKDTTVVGPRKKKYRDLSDDELVGLMMIPSVLGGFPIIYLETMFLRSEADHLPQCIRIYLHLRDKERAVAEILRMALLQVRDSEASLLTILADPRALALTRPQTPMSILRHELDARLEKMARNEELERLYEVYNEEAKDAFITALSHNKVWPARLLAAVYGASGFASREAIVAGFESSRTAIAFLLHTQPAFLKTPDLCRRCLSAIHRTHQWRMELISGGVETRMMVIPNCPTMAADMLREYHWQRKVTTITTPPMGHLFRLEQRSLALPGETYILIGVGEVKDRVGNVSDHLTYGEFKPFVGHTTSSATRANLDIIRSKDLLVDSVLDLAVLHSWAELIDEDGSVRKLVDQLISAYTSLPAEKLQILGGTRSHGTIEHHLRSRGFNPTIAPNFQGSILSLLTYDTKTAHAFQTGAKYTVNFLQEVLFAECMLLMELQCMRRLRHLNTSWILSLHECECFTPIRPEKITARDVQGLARLRSSLLPPDGRRALDEQLLTAIKEAGDLGVYSRREPTSEGAGMGLLIKYWSDLACTIETTSSTTTSDALSWHDLAYLKGVKMPKAVSLNILRRLPPQLLATLLRLFNAVNVMTERRRSEQLVPTRESPHTPGSSSLIYICQMISEGGMVTTLTDQLGVLQGALEANVSPLYQIVWNTLTNEADAECLRTLWLPADIELHSFIRILRFIAYTCVVDHEWDHARHSITDLRNLYDEFTARGTVTPHIQRVFGYVGVYEYSQDFIVTLHRANPTILQDAARTGITHYNPPRPNVPPNVRVSVTVLAGFAQSLEYIGQLRPVEDASLESTLGNLDDAPLYLWKTTTKSPSRVLYAFCAMRLEIEVGTRVALVGDGLGGITHFFTCINRDLTIFYSTLFVGPQQEQPAGAIDGPFARVRTEYTTYNLRDVLIDHWAQAWTDHPELVVDLLISDAELVGEQHIRAARNLAKTFQVNGGHLLMMRVRTNTTKLINRVMAVFACQAAQVAFIRVPGHEVDGYVVARYGRRQERALHATAGSELVLGSMIRIMRTPSMDEMIGWCEDHGARQFPILDEATAVGFTPLLLTSREVAYDFVTGTVPRHLDVNGPLDIGTLKRLLTLLMAVCQSHPSYERFAVLLGDDYEVAISESYGYRAVLRSLSAHNYFAHRRRQELVLDDDF